MVRNKRTPISWGTDHLGGGEKKKKNGVPRHPGSFLEGLPRPLPGARDPVPHHPGPHPGLGEAPGRVPDSLPELSQRIFWGWTI